MTIPVELRACNDHRWSMGLSSEVAIADDDNLPFLQGMPSSTATTPGSRAVHACDSAQEKLGKGTSSYQVRGPKGCPRKRTRIVPASYGIGRGLCAITGSPCLTRRFLWWVYYH